MLGLSSLVFRSVWRNKLRTMLTASSVFVLTFVVSMIWSILIFLENTTAPNTRSSKGIATEKWSLPSQLPISYAEGISEGGAVVDRDDIRPMDSMTWQFYAGSTDPKNRTPQSTVFAIAVEPQKILTMMEELDSLQGNTKVRFTQVVSDFEKNPHGIILGRQRIRNLNRQVGDHMTLYGFAYYKDLEIEVEIVGTFPPGRYDNSAIIQKDYFNRVMDAYPSSHQGRRHPLAEKSLNAVWMKVPNVESLTRIDRQIQSSGKYSQPSVKVETVAAGMALFVDAYSDIVQLLRWIVIPSVMVTLAIVVSNASSISVRERRTEIAVLKVLGFRPINLFMLVILESIFVSGLAGAIGSISTYLLVNHLIGGIAFPIAFFTKFFIDASLLWWGALVGVFVGIAGSVIPAVAASKVKSAEVFARVE